MTVRVGINGFGRIGRNFLRAVLATGADIEVVGINDLTSPETLAHLLRYDSTQGRLSVPVDVEGTDLLVGDRHIRVMAEREPGQAALGRARRRRGDRVHRALHRPGATPRSTWASTVKRVIISAPSGDADATFVDRRERRGLRPRQGRRGLERVVHDELLRADGEGGRRRLRDRERAHDDGARVHERPEPAGPAAQGPAPGPGGGGQHRADARPARPGRRAWCSRP